MKRKKAAAACLVLVPVLILLAVYPAVEIDTGSRLIKCSYTGDYTEFEQNASYNETYFYNEDRDISICSFDVKKFLWFHAAVMEYIPGDERKTEFMLEASYMTDFVENAKIRSNDQHIDIAALIRGREAVVSNTRYPGNDYENAVYYTLNGKNEVMYVYETDGLLVIQVGFSDEQPRYIAYRQKGPS